MLVVEFVYHIRESRGRVQDLGTSRVVPALLDTIWRRADSPAGFLEVGGFQVGAHLRGL